MADKKEIKWYESDPGAGWIQEADGYGHRCLTRKRAIEEMILGYVHRLPHKPEELTKAMAANDPTLLTTAGLAHSGMDAIRMAYPSFGFLTEYIIADRAKKEAWPFLYAMITDLLQRDPDSLTNLEFLYYLAGKGRNWKSGCVICLADKTMGTTCGCGHTEILVFRPCGHSICIRPCFLEFVVQKELMTRENAMSDFVKNYDQKFTKKDPCPFQCVTCRSKITAMFEAERTWLYTMFQEPAKAIANKILEDLFFPIIDDTDYYFDKQEEEPSNTKHQKTTND